jgi:hypothetical protein
MSGAIPPLPNTPSWRGAQVKAQGKLYLLHTYIHTYIHTHTHTHINAYVLWIRKFLMTTIGCGINHKGTKHSDKCSNNKTKTT